MRVRTVAETSEPSYGQYKKQSRPLALPLAPRLVRLPLPSLIEICAVTADFSAPCMARLTQELADGRVPPEARADLALTQVHLTRRSVPDEDPEKTLLGWLAQRGFHDVLALRADESFEVNKWTGVQERDLTCGIFAASSFHGRRRGSWISMVEGDQNYVSRRTRVVSLFVDVCRTSAIAAR